MDRSIDSIIRLALSEDIGAVDITSDATIPVNAVSQAEITAKQDLVLAGLESARAVFQQVDPSVRFEPLAKDGNRIKKGAVIARVSGKTRSLLAGERVALNLLQHLSGIAALTAKYVALTRGTSAKILDTRKTLPGLRTLEKYAVTVGGGMNHRKGLYDMVLIKDNHIKAAGGITPAVRLARERYHSQFKIEVETATLEDVREALAAGVDIIMLDNMPPAMMREAVQIISGKIPVEASGNVSLKTVRDIAKAGVDLISVGALTHSAPAADISMKII